MAAPRGLDGVVCGLERRIEHVELAVRRVEHRVERAALRGREAEVVVHLLPPRFNRRLRLAEHAVGRKADDTANEDGAEEEREGLLLGALHGRGQREMRK